MANIKFVALAVGAVFIYTACARDALANNANVTKAAEKTALAGPPKVALVALENSAYAAWKTKDSNFWDTFLSDNFVGWGTSGKLDKASAKKEYTGAGCEIKSYALSDEQMKLLGNRAALITYKTTIDGTCGGHRVPANSWAASVYVREGDQWKGVFHAESPVVDPTAAAASPLVNKEAPKAPEARPTARDAGTDAKKIAGLTANDISFINIFGTYLATKADALKNWAGAGCDVKTVSVTNAAGTMLSPTVGILTFNGAADGTCYGQKVGPIWGTSIYVKGRDAWKWTFGINVPARGEGT